MPWSGTAGATPNPGSGDRDVWPRTRANYQPSHSSAARRTNATWGYRLDRKSKRQTLAARTCQGDVVEPLLAEHTGAGAG